MGRYLISETRCSATAVTNLISKYQLKEWGDSGRYYLGRKELADLIGLEVSYYKSGSVSGCRYLDEDGRDVIVAHARAYDFGSRGHKTFVKGGRVYCEWHPYDKNVAEVIALAIEREDKR